MPAPGPAVIDFDAALTAAGERLLAAARGGPLGAPVGACPGWDLAALLGHCGGVHRWAAAAVRAGSDPAGRLRGFPEPPPGGDPVAWYGGGLDELRAALLAAGPAAPCWTLLGPGTSQFWWRRQTHEVTVHAHDAARAVGEPDPPVDPALARDGIAEFGEVFVARRRPPPPACPVVLACTDLDARFLLDGQDTPDGVSAHLAELAGRDPAPVAAVSVAATAAELYLLLWNRVPPDAIAPGEPAGVVSAFLAGCNI